MNVWFKHECLGEFLPPHNDLIFSDAGSVSKDMKRGVITLCKHTKDIVYDRRKEERKNNVGRAIRRSQPEICLDIRKKDHKLQGEKVTLGQILHKYNKRRNPFLIFKMVDAKHNAMKLLVAGRDRPGKIPLLLSKFIHIDGKTDVEKGRLHIAR